ncbi:serine/threonine protein phosphatase [Nibribacter ruber]|uniref:Serine/threonine protein phosphatase n=1 Tax=Nibribacter ruber TaxID=2698458 RepID=A0A6P1NYC6_9BACT|nr:metallophosphoesterase family protein [Nibribacter ruber]QHL88050.1 serine/threonine protein phosphatase [Nibribacter ruber]
MARYAISDIHGCLATFKALVEERLQLQPHDHLYLLGDYVNKGPDSKGVLDYLLQLQRDGYQLTCLRGNHDQLFLDAVQKGAHTVWLSPEDQQTTLRSFGVDKFEDIPAVYIQFIQSMPLLVVLDDYILVHAGLDFSQLNLLTTDSHTLLNIKRFQPTAKKLGARTLLHGHMPVSKAAVEKAVTQKRPAFNLDAGCVYYKNAEFGWMCGFGLDSKALFWQENMEGEYDIKVKA